MSVLVWLRTKWEWSVGLLANFIGRSKRALDYYFFGAGRDPHPNPLPGQGEGITELSLQSLFRFGVWRLPRKRRV